VNDLQINKHLRFYYCAEVYLCMCEFVSVCMCVCVGDVDGVGGEFLAPALETFSMPAVELERAQS